MFGFGNRQRDPNRVELKPWQRLLGLGANVLFPGAGVASNMIFNGLNNRQQTPINPNSMQGWNTSPNLGFGVSPMRPSVPDSSRGAAISNQQLSDMFDNGPSLNLADRQNSNNVPLMGAAGQFIQPNQQPNTQQQVSQMPAAMQTWIRNNGLPQTPDDIRRATNAMYLDQATAMANANYGQDIGFIAPQARAPRER